MRRLVLSSALLTLLGVTTFAQNDAEANHTKWMKDTGATMGSLKKNLDAKSGDAAAADAKKLQTLFTQVHDFWAEKKVDDAVTSSKEAGSAFEEIGKLAASGNFDEASAAFKKAQGACGSCHKVHREKAADGSYKYKY